MRVIAGTLGGRRLQSPPGSVTRPTSDRVREALFATLGPIDGLSVLDLFAGSGALAIEALSRGASHGTLLESGRNALKCIEANARDLGLRDKVTAILGDAERSLGRIAGPPVRVLFADPPYDLVETDGFFRFLTTARDSLRWEEEALVVLEHRANDTVPALEGIVEETLRTWGDTSVWIGRVVPAH